MSLMHRRHARPEHHPGREGSGIEEAAIVAFRVAILLAVAYLGSV